MRIELEYNKKQWIVAFDGLQFIPYAKAIATNRSTGEVRTAKSNREMFRKEVVLETGERVITINDREQLILQLALSDAYLKSCEEGTQDSVGVEIDQLYLKITGLPGRRVVLREE